jgi:hypothetical protein
MTSGAIQCGVPINVLRFVIVLVSCGSAAFSCAMQCSFAAADCCDVRGVLRCRSGGLHGATQRKCAQRAGGAAGARSTYPSTCVAIQRTHVPHPPPPNTHTHTHTHTNTHTHPPTHTPTCAAIPKSASLTVPSCVSRMLPHLMSRWTRPRLCR